MKWPRFAALFWITAFCLQMALPYLAVYPSGHPVPENALTLRLFDGKVLTCTHEGFRFVPLEEFQRHASHAGHEDHSNHYKCPACYIVAQLGRAGFTGLAEIFIDSLPPAPDTHFSETTHSFRAAFIAGPPPSRAPPAFFPAV